MTTKQQIITALGAFINQRSGIEWGNYGGSREAFMGDYRPILKHGRHARTLLKAVELRDSITAEEILNAAKHAFSGRLEIEKRDDGRVSVHYCTGQYFPTEYRNAVCAVLASVLWHFWQPEAKTGDDIRRQARREFGPAIAKTWFA